jgi:hypothetical protein
VALQQEDQVKDNIFVNWHADTELTMETCLTNDMKQIEYYIEVDLDNLKELLLTYYQDICKVHTILAVHA